MLESWIERMNRTWKRFQIDCLEILVGEIISNGICWIGIGIDSFRSPSLLTCYLDRPVLYLWYWGCVTDMRSYWDFREVRIIPIREMYMNYTIACLSRCYQYCLMRKRSETAWYSNSKRKWCASEKLFEAKALCAVTLWFLCRHIYFALWNS
jgi:hypothetical protein